MSEDEKEVEFFIRTEESVWTMSVDPDTDWFDTPIVCEDMSGENGKAPKEVP